MSLRLQQAAVWQRPASFAPSRLRRPSPAVRVATSPAATTAASLDWTGLAKAEVDVGQWALRPGQVPSSSPQPSLPTSETSDTPKRVLLYRDTNGWCPFCERVLFALLEKDIDHDSVFIDLRDKPEWYKEMVPSALVPAVKIDGKIVYESADILRELDVTFPEVPLLPEDQQLLEKANNLMKACDTDGVGGPGYKFMTGGRTFGPPKDGNESPPTLEELQRAFEDKLQSVEDTLGETEGPFFLPEFGLVDVMYTTAMQRMAANLTYFRGFHIRGNPSYPRVNAWLEAIESRPTYKSIMTDSATHNLLVSKVFGMGFPEPNTEPTESELEAGTKLSKNHKAVVKDILKNADLFLAEEEAVVEVVELTVYNLAARLLGQPQKKAAEDVETKYSKPVMAATLAYLRNRVSAPRDMSALAATAFRASAEAQLTRVY